MILKMAVVNNGESLIRPLFRSCCVAFKMISVTLQMHSGTHFSNEKIKNYADQLLLTCVKCV